MVFSLKRCRSLTCTKRYGFYTRTLPFVYLYKTLCFLHENVAVRLLLQNVIVFRWKRCRSITGTKRCGFYRKRCRSSTCAKRCGFYRKTLPFVYLYKTLCFLHENVAVRLLVQTAMVFTRKRCRSFTCTKNATVFTR